MTIPTALYRQRDAEGRCLYIGVSANATARLLTHVKDSSEWVQSVAHIDVEWFPTREAAFAAEAAAIKAEQPPFNITHGPHERRKPRCEGPTKLRLWMLTSDVSPEWLAARILSTPYAVRQMAAGRRRVHATIAQKLEALSHGAVPAESWTAPAHDRVAA